MCPGEDICNLVVLATLDKKLEAPRLDFLELPQGKGMSDGDRVKFAGGECVRYLLFVVLQTTYHY